jgi:uncharacterized protein YndB with AHSA1/START domain/catechol 2,3-dioxygenase-like lactoylglutathione lyase family enzyme
MMQDDQIVHDVVVAAGPAGAFDAFTTHLGAWWPLAFTFSAAAFADAAVEPKAGGMWFERNNSGERVSWGEVRAYEPAARLVLAFAIGPDRTPVSNDAASEVEVRFAEAGPGRARVTIEHRDFGRHGSGGDKLRAGMDSVQGWPLILAEFRRWIDARPTVRYIVRAMDPAVAFYTGQLGFAVDMRPAPGFTALSRGAARLYLNEPGAGGAGASTRDGRRPEPGGWNRLQLVFPDLASEVRRLRDGGCRFRTDLVEGNGGRQILLEDPSGNPIELFEPKTREGKMAGTQGFEPQ